MFRLSRTVLRPLGANFTTSRPQTVLKKSVVNYRITTQLVAKKKLPRDSANVGSVHGGLCACFSVYTYLIFRLNITRYTLYNWRLWASLIWIRIRTIVGLL